MRPADRAAVHVPHALCQREERRGSARALVPQTHGVTASLPVRRPPPPHPTHLHGLDEVGRDDARVAARVGPRAARLGGRGRVRVQPAREGDDVSERRRVERDRCPRLPPRRRLPPPAAPPAQRLADDGEGLAQRVRVALVRARAVGSPRRCLEEVEVLPPSALARSRAGGARDCAADGHADVARDGREELQAQDADARGGRARAANVCRGGLCDELVRRYCCCCCRLGRQEHVAAAAAGEGCGVDYSARRREGSACGARRRRPGCAVLPCRGHQSGRIRAQEPWPGTPGCLVAAAGAGCL